MAAILSRPHCVFVFVFDELYLYLYLYLIWFLPAYLYLYLYLYLKLRKKMYLYLYLYLIKRIWPQPWYMYIYRADSGFVPSQWETLLLCNDVSHWLGASLESALYIFACCYRVIQYIECFNISNKITEIILNIVWKYATWSICFWTFSSVHYHLISLCFSL